MPQTTYSHPLEMDLTRGLGFDGQPSNRSRGWIDCPGAMAAR